MSADYKLAKSNAKQMTLEGSSESSIIISDWPIHRPTHMMIVCCSYLWQITGTGRKYCKEAHAVFSKITLDACCYYYIMYWFQWQSRENGAKALGIGLAWIVNLDQHAGNRRRKTGEVRTYHFWDTRQTQIYRHTECKTLFIIFIIFCLFVCNFIVSRLYEQ